MDLPQLKGSVAQCDWACTIREKCLSKLSDIDMTDVEIVEAFDILKNKPDATYWINNRFKSAMELFKAEHYLIKNKDKIKKEFNFLSGDAKARTMLAAQLLPTVTSTIDNYCEILNTVNNITINFKYASIRDHGIILRNLHYETTDGYTRYVKQKSLLFEVGVEDAMAYVASILLDLGYRVVIYDDLVIDKVKTKSFENDCCRWIYSKFDSIRMHYGYNDTIYSWAKEITGFEYSKGEGFIISCNVNKHVITEFINHFKFRVTSDVQAILDKWDRMEAMTAIEIDASDTDYDDLKEESSKRKRPKKLKPSEIVIIDELVDA